MAKRTWEVLLEDGTHRIELSHGFISGRKEIRVDGQVLPLPAAEQSMADFGGEYPFLLGSHQGVVHIRTNGITFQYDLTIDGRSVESGDFHDPGQAARNRQIGRWGACAYAIIAGILCLVFGDRFRFMGIPLTYVGVVVLAVGILGLMGVNVFYGGPLDKRNDQ